MIFSMSLAEKNRSWILVMLSLNIMAQKLLEYCEYPVKPPLAEE